MCRLHWLNRDTHFELRARQKILILLISNLAWSVQYTRSQIKSRTVQFPGGNCGFSHVPLPPPSDSSPELLPSSVYMYFTHTQTHICSRDLGSYCKDTEATKKSQPYLLLPYLPYTSYVWNTVVNTKDTKIKAWLRVSPLRILWQALLYQKKQRT